MKAKAALASALIGCLLPVSAALAQAAGNAAPAVGKAVEQLENKSVRIVTDDGKVLTGKVISADKGKLVVETAPDNKTTIKRSNIESIRLVAQNAAGAFVIRQAGVPYSQGSAAQARPDAKPEEDTERFLLLAPTGPILIESRVTIDGKPFRMAREALVDEMLATADSDGDGRAAWEEALTKGRFLMQGYGRAVLQDSQLAAYVKQYDRNQNGEVDREEVRNFLELTGGPAFQLTAMPYGYNSQPDVRELIDRDGDGAISAEELAAASDRLKSRDANDDDILDAVEISGVYGAYGGNRVLQQRNFGSRAIRTSAAHLLGPAADLVTLYESMKQRYAKDDRLTAETLPAAAQLIESLDLNKNGEFDAGETIGLHLAKPHLVLEVKLFTTPGDRPELIVKSRTESLRAVGDERAPSDTVRLAGYGAELNIQASQAMQTASYKASAERMVAQYDTDKNGYLEKKEFEGNNNAAYFTMQIDVWDADGDGKVFAAEIEADYNRRLAPTISRVAVGAGDLGVSLFGALDASGDNRLGLREMRSAAEQLKRFDKNEDGKILAEEMPSRLEVAFAIGQAALPSQNRIVLPGRGGLTPATRTAPGPKWFVHMDTNGDGDVSRREFIGPIEAFAKLDADGDGLISHEEAK